MVFRYVYFPDICLVACLWFRFCSNFNCQLCNYYCLCIISSIARWINYYSWTASAVTVLTRFPYAVRPKLSIWCLCVKVSSSSADAHFLHWGVHRLCLSCERGARHLYFAYFAVSSFPLAARMTRAIKMCDENLSVNEKNNHLQNDKKKPSCVHS